MPSAPPRLRVAFSRGRDLAGEVRDLLLPAECAGCRTAGSDWCDECAEEVRGGVFPGGPRPVRPDPCPPGLPTVHAASPYAGPLRAALGAYKDEGRRDLARVLAPLLVLSLSRALRSGDDSGGHLLPGYPAGAVLLVPVPSSPASVRRRGDAPLEVLLGHAVRALVRSGASPPAGAVAVWSPPAGAVAVCPALALTRRVADQAGLDHVQRAANLRDAMAVRRSAAAVVRGRQCLLVDDVLTTGATLAEAARALARGGAASVRCCTVAATQRRGRP